MIKVKNSGRPLDNQIGIKACHSKSFQSLVFVLKQLLFGQWSSLPFCLASLTVQWPMQQSSILSGKFDCPVACQNLSLLAAHDCETGLWTRILTAIVKDRLKATISLYSFNHFTAKDEFL